MMHACAWICLCIHADDTHAQRACVPVVVDIFTLNNTIWVDLQQVSKTCGASLAHCFSRTFPQISTPVSTPVSFSPSLFLSSVLMRLQGVKCLQIAAGGKPLALQYNTGWGRRRLLLTGGSATVPLHTKPSRDICSVTIQLTFIAKISSSRTFFLCPPKFVALIFSLYNMSLSFPLLSLHCTASPIIHFLALNRPIIIHFMAIYIHCFALFVQRDSIFEQWFTYRV